MLWTTEVGLYLPCRPLIHELPRGGLLGNQISLALNHVEVPALKLQAAGGAVCERFGVCFAPFLIVEKHPLVRSSNPPELPPDRVLLLARTIQCDHLNISLPAHPWAIAAFATNYSIL
jgi:hypothetical protein